MFVELETAQQMIEAEDIRLKEGRMVRTSGFYENGDGGGATYELSAKKVTGSIELQANYLPILYWISRLLMVKNGGIISTKQLGASFANDDDNEIFRSIAYLPTGEYKCTAQVQLNVSNVNFLSWTEDEETQGYEIKQ
ncbi:MAG: hypothetical protein PUC12_12685 [Clostridiales bacterium]|nr:hypothetical protein [Clostridiales bacterium]